MPIVVLTVDANTAGLTAGTEASIKQLGVLAEAIGKISGETTTMASSVARAMEAMNAGIGSTGTAMEQMIAKISGVKTEVGSLTAAVDAAASTQITRIAAIGMAYDGVTAAIKRQVAAMRELNGLPATGGVGTAERAAVAEGTAARARRQPGSTYMGDLATGNSGVGAPYLVGPSEPRPLDYYRPKGLTNSFIDAAPTATSLNTLRTGIDGTTQQTARLLGSLAGLELTVDEMNAALPTTTAQILPGLERIVRGNAQNALGIAGGAPLDESFIRTNNPLAANNAAITQGNIAINRAAMLNAALYDTLATAPTADETARQVAEDAVKKRTATAAVAAEGNARRGTALARAGITDLVGEGAAGATLGPGVLTGPAVAAAVAGFLGYKAVSTANAFQSAEQQTGAQINNQAVARATGNAILAYSKTGGAPYDPTLVMRSIEPLLAHGYSQATINAGIAPLEKLSAQNKAPDLLTAVNGVNTYLAIMGRGAKSTPAQMADAVDYMSKIETKTTIPPGDLSKVLPNLLIAAQQAGVSQDQAAGALIKIGTANANAPQDVTTIGRMMQEMLTKNTPGAMKEAASLGLAMGPGALAAYGGSFEAMVQAYANATAGPNQGHEISLLFPTSGVRGGATAFRELIAGGGTRQALGYEADVANRAGTANAVYADYSRGVNQQAAQVMTEFNTEVIGVGSTLTTTVVPALLLLAKGALDAAGNLGGVLGAAGNDVNKAKNWVDQHIPGGLGTVVAGALPTGWAAAAAKGVYDHAGAIKNAMVGDGTQPTHGPGMPHAGQYWNPRTGQWVDNAAAQYAVPTAENAQYGGITPGNDFVRHLGSMKGGTGEQGMLDTGQGNEFIRHLGSMRGGTGEQGVGSLFAPAMQAFSTLSTSVGRVSGIFDTLGTVVSAGVQGVQNSLGPPTNAPAIADRSILGEMIAGGATTPRLYTQLDQVRKDLLNSKYTPEQQASIMRQSERQVFAAAVGPGDQMRIQAAQMTLDAATQMGEPPKIIKRDQDAYIAALNQYARDTQHGTQLAASLRANAQTAAVYTYGDRVDTVNRSVKDLQNAIALDKTQNNDMAAKADTQKLLAFQARNAGILKLDPSDLALLKAQANADLYATSVVNTHPFFQKNAGLGGFAAGAGTTQVRIGGAVDPATAEIRLLRQELNAARSLNIELLQKIAHNTGVRAQAAGTPGAASGRYATGR